MKPYQERVIAEKSELDDKRLKLVAYVDSHQMETLKPQEQRLIYLQLNAMDLYSHFLGERIAALEPPCKCGACDCEIDDKGCGCDPVGA